jgi:hypothetical protein
MSSNPKAEIQITAESRTLGAKLREARAQLGKFGGALKKEVFGKVLFDSGKASAHMVGQLSAAAVGRGLGFFEDRAREVLDFNEALMRFQLAARRTPEEAAELGAAARQVAVETGIASETALAGERAYVDLAGAENASAASMRTLARTAQASGAAIGDMATVAYSLQNALKVRPDEMEDVIGGLINQSKDGTIHFQNMAQEIIALGPKFARFGTLGREGAAELGALVQVAGSGFKDAAEASTGIQGLFRGLQLHEKLFRKAGVATMVLGKDGAKHLRPLNAIVEDISRSRLMKDPSLLLKDIGRGEGDAFLRLWIEQMGKYQQLVEAAKVNGVVQTDLATVTESTSGRTAIAMERTKNAIAEAFTPERINAFVAAIEGAADKVGPLAEGIGKIGSGLGALYRTGQWLRDEGNENSNPWKDEAAEARVTELALQRRGFRDLEDAAARGVLDKPWAMVARARIANKDAYDAAVAEIVGGGDPDRATPEAIQRAAIASHADQSAPGGAGRVIAAQKYLENAHVSREEANKIYQEALASQAKALQALADKVTAAIKQGFANAKTEVKADGKAIVDVHRGSSVHARRPGG